MATATLPIITATEVALVRGIARRAVGRAGLRRDDEEDLAQDGLSEAWRRRAHFDTSRSTWPAFVATVAHHAVSDAIAYRRAARRDWRRLGASLDDAVAPGDEGASPRGAALSEDAHALRLGAPRLSAAERRDLRLDLRAVLALLPPDLREVSLRLMLFTPTEVARDLGIGRATVYDRMRETREFFLRYGLGIYVAASAAGGGR